MALVDYQPSPLKHFLPVHPLRNMFSGLPGTGWYAGTATEFAPRCQDATAGGKPPQKSGFIPSGYVNVAMEDTLW